VLGIHDLGPIPDALVATLESRADTPNDAELISFCARLMPHVQLSHKQMQDTIQAMLLFEEAAGNVLHTSRDEVPSALPDVCHTSSSSQRKTKQR